jgi:hypothetical protein
MSVVFGWLLAIAGFAVAFVVTLAGAMKSVPRLTAGEALVGLPLPILALAVSIFALVGAMRAKKTLQAVLAVIPAGIALVTLFIVAASYLMQPGR